jgi:hypothetical protein
MFFNKLTQLNKFNNRTTLVFSLFLLSKILVFLVLYAFGCRKMWEGCFAHWDSGLYMSIAQEGHTLFDCNYPNNPQWCGNAGWSPLYPLLMRIVHEITHDSMEHSGGIVSTVFYFFYLKYMARLLNLDAINAHSIVSLFLCAFFPGFIYLHAVFPLSLCLFLITAFIYHLQKQDFLYCGILAMLLSWSYASGLFILLPIAFYFLGILFYEKRWAWKAGFKVVLPVFLGLLMLYGYDYWVTKHWDAMFLVQQKYTHGFYSLFDMFKARFARLCENITNANGIIQLQNFYVFALVIWLVITIIKEFFKDTFNKPELLFYVGFIIAYWLLPFSMGLEISLYRGSITLAVLLLLWRNKSLDFKLMLLLSFAIFIFPMAAYFYKEIMI